MKVVHLSSVHTADDTRIFRKQAQSLASAGYSVTLIVPFADSGERAGVKIRGVRGESKRLARATQTVARVVRAALDEKADLYHLHDPELIPAGLLLKLLGKRVVYDAHEDFPKQVLTKDWLPIGIRRVVAGGATMLDTFCARAFDGVITATPAIARGFRGANLAVVQNFPIVEELVTQSPPPFGQRPPRFAFVGALAAIRGARELVEAISHLSDDLGAKLVIAGPLRPEGLRTELEVHPGWSRVNYSEWMSREQVAQLLNSSQAGLIIFHPAPNHVEAQPNKLFEYMSAGLPVIASDFPLWREIVGGSECGILVDPLNPRAVATAMEWILSHPSEAEAMGRRGKLAVEKIYNWRTEAETLVSFYKEILA